MAQLAAAIQPLLEDRLMSLGHASPNLGVRPRLQALTATSLFVPAGKFDPNFANACLAGLWLWHDFLDEAHAISQEIDTPEGSWWHAIMHRREGDFWNSKYWFRRVESHPAFATLSDRLVALGLPEWDPTAFVDQCERAVRDGGELEQACQRIQREEWRTLFEYCVRHADTPSTIH